MTVKLIQFEDTRGQRFVGLVRDGKIQPLREVSDTRALALRAIETGTALADLVHQLVSQETEDYAAIIESGRLLPPVDHVDPAHMIVAGTGLTHVGSAAARDSMHKTLAEDEQSLTPSMQVFRWGLEGGKPADGKPGAQPEWFFKGDGDIVVRPEAPFPVPAFSQDEGEEPEVVAIYVIGNDGRPYRIGFALGNEATDHVMEKSNYLYLAHSKLRHCSFGPELLVGDLPSHLEGKVRIRRAGSVVWEKPFMTGEDNMCHSLANLEYHHFKYNQFLRAGDVHVQFLGTSVASFGDGVKTEEGDIFEIEIPEFGAPLRNGTVVKRESIGYGEVKPL